MFAAASLQTAFDALAAPAERATGVHMRISYAASSALARQIENGAPADLFISADLDWMDELATRHLIRADTRADLVGNELVLVQPRTAPASALTIGPGFPLAAALGASRLALANPTAVPAGKYAKAALTSLGVWASVAAIALPRPRTYGPRCGSSPAARLRLASSIAATPSRTLRWRSSEHFRRPRTRRSSIRLP